MAILINMLRPTILIPDIELKTAPYYTPNCSRSSSHLLARSWARSWARYFRACSWACSWACSRACSWASSALIPCKNVPILVRGFFCLSGSERGVRCVWGGEPVLPGPTIVRLNDRKESLHPFRIGWGGSDPDVSPVLPRICLDSPSDAALAARKNFFFIVSAAPDSGSCGSCPSPKGVARGGLA